MASGFGISTYVALAVVPLAYLVLAYIVKPKHDAREPPLIPSGIPYIGHLINILRYKMRYYVNLRLIFLHKTYAKHA